MITTDNEFLGVLIKCKNDHNECNIDDVSKTAEISLMDCSYFINSLKEKGYISMISFETIRINPSAFSFYESPQKKFRKSFFQFSVSLLKTIITYILGIFSGLIIAYLAHKFGWQ